MRAPALGEGKRGLDGHLLYLLRQANAAAQQAVDRELSDLNLTLAQYSALTMINAYEGLSNAELSRIAMLTPQSANETVRRLEAAAFIRRRTDPDHGRIIRLEITGKGRDVLKKARRRTDRIEVRLQDHAGQIGLTPLKRFLVETAREFARDADIHDR